MFREKFIKLEFEIQPGLLNFRKNAIRGYVIRGTQYAIRNPDTRYAINKRTNYAAQAAASSVIIGTSEMIKRFIGTPISIY